MDLAAAGDVAGVAVATGATVAILRTTDARLLILATGLVLLFAPLTLAPRAPALPFAFWLVASLLATYLLLIAVRDTSRVLVPLPLGGTAEGLFVLLALGIGFGAYPAAGPERGSAAAFATGVALALAALPLCLFASDALRAGVGAIFLLVAGGLIAGGLAGTPADMLIVGLALSIAATAASTRTFALLTHHGRGELAFGAWRVDPREVP